MYTKFYGLSEKPFNVTADADFFFLSKQHKEAIASLIYGIAERKGILCITGEVGTGKTTLCRALLKRLDKTIKTAFILNPSFSGVQLLQAIIQDFGLPVTNRSKISLVNQLNKFLLDLASKNENAVLIVDESQNLKPSQLEQIRLLSNLETEKEKLLQIILVGQPELQDKLRLDNLRQLRQRIMVNYQIRPFEEIEIKNYIDHRLNIAGADGRVRFHEAAIYEIFNFSGGIPRMINTICDLALLAGFVRETLEINAELIREVRKEFAR